MKLNVKCIVFPNLQTFWKKYNSILNLMELIQNYIQKPGPVYIFIFSTLFANLNTIQMQKIYFI